MDTEEVFSSIKSLADGLSEDTAEKYAHITEEFESNPYVFFDTEFFSFARKEEENSDVSSAKRVASSMMRDSRYTCSKCKSRKIATSQEQTRSADEGATTFYECWNCGFVWR